VNRYHHDEVEVVGDEFELPQGHSTSLQEEVFTPPPSSEPDNFGNEGVQSSSPVPQPEDTPATDVQQELQAVNNQHRYNLRPARSSWRDKYAYAFTNLSVKKGVQTIGVPAITSIMKEMSQLHRKKVFHPVSYEGLDRRQRGKLIRSHLFLKKKRDGTLKSRLVTDGSMEERSASTDTSSPTVSTEALFYHWPLMRTRKGG
jgi:hypothetical protein